MASAAPRKKSTDTRSKLTWRQALARRMRGHQLHTRAPIQAMTEVAGRIGCLHAQLISSAELSLWARLEGLEKDAFSKALWEDRTLVKTWAMRGTMHVLPAPEYALWQAALSTYRNDVPPMSQYLQRLEVSLDELEQLIGAAVEALDGPPLTREELADEISKRIGSRLGDKVRSGWGTLLKPIAFRGQLCFAPGEGQKVRFTRPDRWLGGLTPVDPAYALLEITRRFFHTNGPIPKDDFTRWLGLSPAEGNALIERLGEEIVPVDVEGKKALMLAADLVELTGGDAGGAAGANDAGAGEGEGAVRLLPAFDPYVIVATGHADRMLPGDFRGRIYRPNTWYSPVLLVDGRMEGVWEMEKKGKRLEVKIEPFLPLPPKAREGVEAEADRLARFTGGALSLSFVDPAASA